MRRLQREAKANPVKAGALALMFVVAIWFWAPLVLRWCSPGESQSTPPAEATTESAAPATTESVGQPIAPQTNHGAELNSGVANTAPGANRARPTDWQTLVKAMEQDPRMRPSEAISQWRDPFGPSIEMLAREKTIELAAAVQRTQKRVRRAPAPPAELMPADSGLVLNSTLIGSGRRMAMIGGEPYFEGDTVPAPHGESFVLAEVLARQVVLERGGKKFGLDIKVAPRTPSETAVAADIGAARAEQATGYTHGRSAARESKSASSATPTPTPTKSPLNLNIHP